MASVFTYDPDPPRIASPWFSPPMTMPEAGDAGGTVVERDVSRPDVLRELGGLPVPRLGRLEDYGLLALDAEPELGPVEYKLHLLLRQRQTFVSTSTSHRADAQNRPGAYRPQASRHSIGGTVALRHANPSSIDGADVHPTNSLPYSTSNPQSRQQRLLQLTTQLLWRLKQSSPYHSFSTIDSIAPKLPDASSVRLHAPDRPEKLLPGLEESQGAMYEIGVEDNGNFVGLTREEMEESLINLRAMAASLGCKVQIVRAVMVGVCQPVHAEAEGERAKGRGGLAPMENLYVVEAIVVPDTGNNTNRQTFVTPIEAGAGWNQPSGAAAQRPVQNTEQLRVSLTGSTTSGKSTLLGTLLASTFDDARGKGRLNLLKHRHEIASGVTSSVAHELVGYQKSEDRVVNYAFQNVDLWTDVHDKAEGGRLVLLTDSAGHPRYRRTIVRSLIAWQPHWTLCCIAAVYHAEDEFGLPPDTSSIADGEGVPSPAQALALAHLELCLKLNLPLAVVITKYDLATRGGLRQILSRVLTILKSVGRVPHLLKPSAPVKSEDDLQTIEHHDMHEVRTVIEQMQDDFPLLVPIVLTSSVNGIGISKLHALLRQLPIPLLQDFADNDTTTTSTTLSSSSKQASSSTFFDIDEVFMKDGHTGGPHAAPEPAAVDLRTYVVSGVLKRGTISVGDRLLLGPFSTDVWPSERRPPLDMRRTASYPETYHEMAMRRHAKVAVRRRRSSEDLAESQPERPAFDSSGDDTGDVEGEQEQDMGSEWHAVQVTSVRNLRLPVRTCHADQCATIGITPVEENRIGSALRPRKGMVLLRAQGSSGDGIADKLTVCRTFRAIFPQKDYHIMEPGMQFNVYVGSVRALAKVQTVGALDADGIGEEHLFSLENEVTGNDDKRSETKNIGGVWMNGTQRIEVMFLLINSREYIEVGARVFVMPGHVAGEGVLALNGYVGTVSEVFG